MKQSGKVDENWTEILDKIVKLDKLEKLTKSEKLKKIGQN